MWEIVSLDGLATVEKTRFKTGVTPIPSFWSRVTKEITFSSSSSPTHGTASKYSKHDWMHVLKIRSSATCKTIPLMMDFNGCKTVSQTPRNVLNA
jgi:hypothetical protein